MKTIPPAHRPTISPEEPFALAWSGGGEPPERTIDFGPSADNPRKRALLEGLRRR